MKIISHKDAKKLGLNRYFTGKPCCHGHLSWRSVWSRACIVCQADGIRRWRLNNSEREKETARKWRRNNLKKLAQQKRERRAKDPERDREISRNFYWRHRERRRTDSRDYYRKIWDLLAVLRKEMPELLKEFGL